MADETVMQDLEPTFQMDLAEAIGRLGSAMVGIAREQEELRKVLAKILEERAGSLEALSALDVKVAALAALVDHDHMILEKIAALSPRPKGKPLAN